MSRRASVSVRNWFVFGAERERARYNELTTTYLLRRERTRYLYLAARINAQGTYCVRRLRVKLHYIRYVSTNGITRIVENIYVRRKRLTVDGIRNQ